MRHIKTNKTKTGQAAKSGKKWQWADQMEAFCPFFSFAKTSSNVSEIPKTNYDTNVQYSENIHKEDSQPQLPENNSDLDTIDTECEETTSQNPSFINLATTSESAPALDSTAPSFSTSTPTRKRKRKNESRPTSSVESLINYFQNKKKPEMDAIDLLFSAHARTVKTFSKKRQAIAKLKVSQVIMEQELQNLEEQSSAQQNQDNLFRPISTTSSASSLGRSQSNSPYCENTLLDSLHANQTFCHVNTNMECSQSTDTHNTTVTNYFTQFNPQDQ